MLHIPTIHTHTQVMEMMESEHAEVQRHTLQCISKIMVNNWEFLR